MSTAPTRKPQNPGSNGLERIDRETTETAGRESHALLALARLLGRQAARDFVLSNCDPTAAWLSRRRMTPDERPHLPSPPPDC